MGYASYIVWTYGGFDAQSGPLLVYALQLVLNLAWPLIFFKQKKLKLGMVDNLGEHHGPLFGFWWSSK